MEEIRRSSERGSFVPAVRNTEIEGFNAEPKKPIEGSWDYRGKITRDVSEMFVYDHILGMRVISSIDFIKGKPEWHLSVSKAKFSGYSGDVELSRPSIEEARRILKQFGAEDFDEDNHVPGKARHFWLAVTPTLRKPCDCKENEKPIIEGEYEWRPDDKEPS